MTTVPAEGFASIVGDPIDWQLLFGFFFVLLLGAAIAFTFVARWYAATQPAAAAPAESSSPRA